MSCDPVQKILKSENPAYKVAAADKYFERGKYSQAAQIYEDVLKYFRGSQQAEDVYYRMAYSHFKEGQNGLSQIEFKNFLESYPLSLKTEDALYYYAQTLVNQSPQVDLDQSPTELAISGLLLFVDRFPESSHIEEINKTIDRLRVKVETREYNNSLIYYKILNYRGAVYALRNYLIDYPGSKNREYVEYLIVKSNYEYAENSVNAKKNERYNNTIQAYIEFEERFPSSSYLIEAKKVKELAQARLLELKQNTNN